MSLEAWGDEGNVGPDGYVTEEYYDECNEDRMLFASYLLSALPYLPTHLKGDIEIALMERLSSLERTEAEESSIAHRPKDLGRTDEIVRSLAMREDRKADIVEWLRTGIPCEQMADAAAKEIERLRDPTEEMLAAGFSAYLQRMGEEHPGFSELTTSGREAFTTFYRAAVKARS